MAHLGMRRRARRRYSTPSQTVTSSTGSGKNYVRTTTHTPSDTEVEEESGGANVGLPKGPSGSAGTVVLVGTALQTNIDGRMVLGGILFITIAAVIASQSPDAGGIMIMIMVAMWLAYITLGTGGNQLNKFFSWFQQTPGAIGGGTIAKTQPSGGGGATTKK